MPHEINHSYKAVIFDMDGTVLDTLSELTHSLNHIFRLHQMPELPPQEVRLCLGYGYTGLIERAAPSVPADEQALLAEEFKQYYSAHCQGNTRPYDASQTCWQRCETADTRRPSFPTKDKAPYRSSTTNSSASSSISP